MPDQFATARQQLLAQLGVTATVGDVPLTGGDNLERLSPFSKNFTGCVIGRGSPSMCPVAEDLTIRSLAVWAVAPAIRS